MLYRKSDPRTRYIDVFAEGEKAGFRVADVRIERSHGVGGRPLDSSVMDVDTPYTYCGEPVKARVTVDCFRETADGLREYRDMCLVSGRTGERLEDMSFRDSGTSAYVLEGGPDGPVAGTKGLEEACRFAAAASVYPHVAGFDEYRAMTTDNYARMKLDDLLPGSTPDNDRDWRTLYADYLEHMARVASDPQARIIGKLESAERIREQEGLYRDDIEDGDRNTGREKESCQDFGK